MDTARHLVAGQRLRLDELTQGSELDVLLDLKAPTPSQVSPMFLCLDREKRIVDGTEVVYPNSTISQCGGVELIPTNRSRFRFTLRLSRLSERVERLLLAVGRVDSAADPTGNGFPTGTLRLASKGLDLASYAFSSVDFVGEKAVCLLELYRKGTWRVAISSGGFHGGIPALLSNYRASPDLTRAVEGAAVPFPARLQRAGLALPAEWPGRRPPNLPQDLLRSVGAILVEESDGDKSTGTGFVVGPGGLVLTSAHVVSTAVSARIALGGSSELRDLEIVTADEATDVALLHISDRQGCVDWLLLEDLERERSLGLSIGILGYPLGLHLGLDVSYCEGVVNSIRLREGVRVLQIDAGAAPGSSGAPVFSRDTGRVVGIVTSGLSLSGGGMHINFAVDIRMVQSLGWFARPVPTP